MLNTKLKKDYFYTYLTYGISFISTLAVYYFVTQRFEYIEFEKYNLSRRVIGITSVILMLGVAVSLPKSVAVVSFNKNSTLYNSANLFSVLIFVLTLASVFSLTVFLFPNFYGQIFWNTNQYKNLLKIISVFVVSSIFFNIVFSFSRGIMDMFFANVMTLCNALIPLCFLPFLNKIENYYLAISYFNFFLASLFLYWIIKKHKLKIFYSASLYRRQLSKILTFGIPRVPGDFALEGILSMPVFITAHMLNTEEASNLGFAISLISMVGTFISPVSIILLPYSAKLMYEKNLTELNRHVHKIFLLFLPVMLVITLMFILFSDLITENYFNNLSRDVSFYMKVVSGVFLPYSVYLIVRSVNDIFYIKPVNAINTIFSLSVLLISALFFYKLGIFKYPAIASLYLGVFCLGLTSYYTYFNIDKR